MLQFKSSEVILTVQIPGTKFKSSHEHVNQANDCYKKKMLLFI